MARPYFVSNMKIYRKRNESSLKKLFTNNIFKKIFIVAFLILFLYSFVRMTVLKLPYIEALYETYLIFFTNVREFIVSNKKNNNLKIKIINIIWTFTRYIFFTIVVAQSINIILKTTDYITDEEYKNIKKINIVKGTSYVDFVKNIGKHPELNNTNKEIIEKIYKSNYDEYWLDDYNVIINAIDSSKYNLELDSTLNNVVNDEFTIIVNKNSPEILEKINKTIVEMQDDGDMLSLCKNFMKVNFENCLI